MTTTLCTPTGYFSNDGRALLACGSIANPAGYCCEHGTAVVEIPTITYTTHSPIGPRGQLVFEDWTDLWALIDGLGWSGLVTVYCDGGPLHGYVTVRYVNGRATNDVLANTLRVESDTEGERGAAGILLVATLPFLLLLLMTFILQTVATTLRTVGSL